jgi:hypothetical protein
MGLSTETIRLLSSKLGRRAASAVAADIGAGGGGGGLVVGTWEEVDLGGATLSGVLVLGSVEGPCEYEFEWVGQPTQSGGFFFDDVDTGQEFSFNNQSFGDWTPLLVDRFIVPAGANVQVRPMFGAVDSFIAQRLRRRTLS